MNVLKTVDVCVKRRVLEDPLLQKNKMILCAMFLYEVQENLLHQQVKNCKFVNPLWKILQKSLKITFYKLQLVQSLSDGDKVIYKLYKFLSGDATLF